MPSPAAHPRTTRRAALAIAGLATVGTLVAWQSTTVSHHVNLQLEKHRVLRQLQEMPALKLNVHVKRDSMKIHGATTFSIYANPVVGTLGDNQKIMTYDGVAEFEENGVQHNYILANGVSYVVTKSNAPNSGSDDVQCLDASSMLPIEQFLNGINNAKPATLSPDSPQQVQCESGQLMQMQVLDDTFVLCSGSAKGFQIFGTDIDVNVEFLQGIVDIPVPEMSEDALELCRSVPSFAAVQPTTFDLLRGAGASIANRHLQASQPIIIPAATCACKGQRRPCIFFHGLNQKTDGPLNDTSTYFGNIAATAPCCTSIKYAQIDTVTQGWNASRIQDQVCNLTLSMSNTSSLTRRTIENTIIVTHSMANLMLAGAIANAKCSLSTTSSWVGLAGPIRGSMGSDYLQQSCNGGGGLGGLLANFIGGCPANTAVKALAYEGGAYSNAALNAQYDAAQVAYQKYVSAAMCSEDYNGRPGGDQLTYRLAGSIINHKSSKNDGVVEYTSCVADIPVANFKPTYESKFYTTKLNHMDMAFRNGDSTTNNQQKPIKWFECLL